MPRAYSLDLRDRVVASVLSGRSRRATARMFGVSIASVIKWMQRWEATGSVAAKPMGHQRPLILMSERDWLLARLGAKPDLTLRGLQAELAARGVEVGYSAVWKFFTAEGISFKKNTARFRARSSGCSATPVSLEETPEKA